MYVIRTPGRPNERQNSAERFFTFACVHLYPMRQVSRIGGKKCASDFSCRESRALPITNEPLPADSFQRGIRAHLRSFICYKTHYFKRVQRTKYAYVSWKKKKKSPGLSFAHGRVIIETRKTFEQTEKFAISLQFGTYLCIYINLYSIGTYMWRVNSWNINSRLILVKLKTIMFNKFR